MSDTPEMPPWRAISGKVRRLLLPMLCVGTLFWLTRDISGATQQALWTIPIMPFAHFWFLQATFLILTSFLLLSWLSGGRHAGVAFTMMLLGLAAWLILPALPINIFSIRQACFLMIFFAAGVLLASAGQRFNGGRIPVSLGEKRLLMVLLAASLICGALLAADLVTLPETMRPAIGVALGLIFCPILFLLRPSNRLFARLGRYSFGIYLFHVFFTAGTREAFYAAFSNTPLLLVWIVSLAAGLIGPVLLEMVIVRSRLASFLLLGHRWHGPAPAKSRSPMVNAI